MDIKDIKLPDLLKLQYEEGRLVLTDGRLKLCADLNDMLPRLKPGNLNAEMIVKASRIKNTDMPLTLIDATAGFGEDSFLLAAAGFNVMLYEYDPVIAALLEDSLKRAKELPELKDTADRMTLFKEDSIEAMKHLSFKPDVILLDPMFPERKKSGLIKKKFQMLQQLETPCSNEEDLFMAAFEAKPRKIVIKRPLKGPFLAGKKPDYSISGKAIRYDCFYFDQNNKD